MNFLKKIHIYIGSLLTKIIFNQDCRFIILFSLNERKRKLEEDYTYLKNLKPSISNDSQDIYTMMQENINEYKKIDLMVNKYFNK